MKGKETGASVPATDERLAMDFDGSGTLAITVTGDWLLAAGPPSFLHVDRLFEENTNISEVALNGKGILDWDSSLLTFLARLYRIASEKGVKVRSEGLPKGAVRLLERAESAPRQISVRKSAVKEDFFSLVGARTLSVVSSTSEALEFIGEVFVAFARLWRLIFR